MFYEENNVYYIKMNDLYFIADVSKKKRTISVIPTNDYVLELENPTELTFAELKKKVLGR